jgi:hypothetical protein
MNEEELNEIAKRILAGEQWVKDTPNILSPESLAKIEAALQQGVVFGLHMHYYGGRSLDTWVFVDFNSFREYLSLAHPGDLFTAWSVRDLEEKELVLAHGQSSPNAQANPSLISKDNLQSVGQYLRVQYNEIFNVYLSWDTRTATTELGDRDSFEDLENDIRQHSYANSEIYVFPFNDIDKPEHYLLKAKYPNDKGEVPLGGAY